MIREALSNRTVAGCLAILALVSLAGIGVFLHPFPLLDGGIDLPVAPGPAHGVGDDDGDGDAESLAQAGPQPGRAAVGIDGQ